MSNITLNVDDNTYRTARIVAAERGTSVSAMVRDYLQSLRPSQQDERVNALAETFEWANNGYSASSRLSRDELYDRAAMRKLHASEQ
jgi:plasmid stability protein